MTPVGTKLRGDYLALERRCRKGGHAGPKLHPVRRLLQLRSNSVPLLFRNSYSIPTLFQLCSSRFYITLHLHDVFEIREISGGHFCGRSYWFQASSHEVLHLSGRQKVVWKYLIGWRLSGMIQAALSIDSAPGRISRIVGRAFSLGQTATLIIW